MQLSTTADHILLSFDATWLEPELEQQRCPPETRFCAVLDKLKMILSQLIIIFIAAISQP